MLAPLYGHISLMIQQAAGALKRPSKDRGALQHQAYKVNTHFTQHIHRALGNYNRLSWAVGSGDHIPVRAVTERCRLY